MSREDQSYQEYDTEDLTVEGGEDAPDDVIIEIEDMMIELNNIDSKIKTLQDAYAALKESVFETCKEHNIIKVLSPQSGSVIWGSGANSSFDKKRFTEILIESGVAAKVLDTAFASATTHKPYTYYAYKSRAAMLSAKPKHSNKRR